MPDSERRRNSAEQKDNKQDESTKNRRRNGVKKSRYNLSRKRGQKEITRAKSLGAIEGIVRIRQTKTDPQLNSQEKAPQEATSGSPGPYINCEKSTSQDKDNNNKTINQKWLSK